MLIAAISIGFVAGVSITLVVIHFFLKRYMQMHQQTKAQHRVKFQELINRVYHKDQIPRAKRIRGLTNLGLPATLKLSVLHLDVQSALSRAINQVSLAGKEHHHGYAKFAQAEIEAAIGLVRQCQSKNNEIGEYWRYTQQVSEEHEENVVNTVKEFEHYQ